MTSIDVRIQVLEHRMSYLESIIEKLTLEELLRRRQIALEQYRQRYSTELDMGLFLLTQSNPIQK